MSSVAPRAPTAAIELSARRRFRSFACVAEVAGPASAGDVTTPASSRTRASGNPVTAPLGHGERPWRNRRSSGGGSSWNSAPSLAIVAGLCRTVRADRHSRPTEPQGLTLCTSPGKRSRGHAHDRVAPSSHVAANERAGADDGVVADQDVGEDLRARSDEHAVADPHPSPENVGPGLTTVADPTTASCPTVAFGLKQLKSPTRMSQVNDAPAKTTLPRPNGIPARRLVEERQRMDEVRKFEPASSLEVRMERWVAHLRVADPCYDVTRGIACEKLIVRSQIPRSRRCGVGDVNRRSRIRPSGGRFRSLGWR